MNSQNSLDSLNSQNSLDSLSSPDNKTHATHRSVFNHCISLFNIPVMVKMIQPKICPRDQIWLPDLVLYRRQDIVCLIWS